jgi:glycerate kinase
MLVLCAPDSFKGSISAADAACAMAKGVTNACPDADVDLCPVSDGGEGLIDVLVKTGTGSTRRSTVRGPLGLAAPSIEARFGVLESGRIGVIELAEAAGLACLDPSRRDPMRTTTFGVGQLIRAASDSGCEEIIVGLGGSATVDGGCGLAQALGARFFDSEDRLIETPLSGGMLGVIQRVEIPRSLPPLRIACDVTNPLFGPRGAAAIFGPQKGAASEQVSQLEAGLRHLSSLVDTDPDQPGAGAAGGAGFGLVAFCGATLERGIELVLDRINFDARCRDATLVLAGEGRLDAQSMYGKACMGVALRAQRAGVPCVGIVGGTGEGHEAALASAPGGALDGVVSLTELFGVDRAMKDPVACIAEAASRLAATVRERSL